MKNKKKTIFVLLLLINLLCLNVYANEVSLDSLFRNDASVYSNEVLDTKPLNENEIVYTDNGFDEIEETQIEKDKNEKEQVDTLTQENKEYEKTVKEQIEEEQSSEKNIDTTNTTNEIATTTNQNNVTMKVLCVVIIITVLICGIVITMMNVKKNK